MSWSDSRAGASSRPASVGPLAYGPREAPVLASISTSRRRRRALWRRVNRLQPRAHADSTSARRVRAPRARSPNRRQSNQLRNGPPGASLPTCQLPSIPQIGARSALISGGFGLLPIKEPLRRRRLRASSRASPPDRAPSRLLPQLSGASLRDRTMELAESQPEKPASNRTSRRDRDQSRRALLRGYRRTRRAHGAIGWCAWSNSFGSRGVSRRVRRRDRERPPRRRGKRKRARRESNPQPSD